MVYIYIITVNNGTLINDEIVVVVATFQIQRRQLERLKLFQPELQFSVVVSVVVVVVVVGKNQVREKKKIQYFMEIFYFIIISFILSFNY